MMLVLASATPYVCYLLHDYFATYSGRIAEGSCFLLIRTILIIIDYFTAYSIHAKYYHRKIVGR